MARKKNSKLGAILFGPALVIGGLMALWENEGRFDYYAAARDAAVVEAPSLSVGEPIAYSGRLKTDIPIADDYVTEFVGYHLVWRRAEIYSWDRSTDSDNNERWSLGWHSSLESNSRNTGLSQTLSSATLYPNSYRLGSLEVAPKDIHFVDDSVAIAAEAVRLNRQGVVLELQPSGGYLYLDKGRSDDLGDERISYSGIPNSDRATYFGVVLGGRAVGRQFEQNEGIISAIIANDGILHHLVNGEREGALQKIKADLTRKTWLVRIGGTVAVVIGFAVFFGVFVSLLYRIPVLGRIAEIGVLLISAVLGLSLSLVVILTSLILHNPLTVALPLALLVGGIVWFVRRSRAAAGNAQRILAGKMAAQRLAAQAAAEPPPPPPAAAPAAEPPAPPPPAASAPSDADLIERTFTNLALVAMREGELHRKENKFLVAWGKDNGIPPERMKQLFEAAKNDPPESHPATRDDLELMACMAMADGVLSGGEWEFLRKLAVRIGLEPWEMRKMLSDIEGGAAVPA